jgi:hypothetical protein
VIESFADVRSPHLLNLYALGSSYHTPAVVFSDAHERINGQLMKMPLTFRFYQRGENSTHVDFSCWWLQRMNCWSYQRRAARSEWDRQELLLTLKACA